MENLRRTLSYGSKMPDRRPQPPSPSFFHHSAQVTGELNECWTSSMLFLDALLKFCASSTQMSEKFTRAFAKTAYADSSSQFHSATRDLYAATTSVSGQLKSKLDAWFMGIMTRTDNEDYSQVLAKCYLNLIQLHCQFVVTSTDVLSQFCNYNNIEDMQSQPKQPSIPKLNVTNTDDVTGDVSNSWVDDVWNSQSTSPVPQPPRYQAQRTYVPDGQPSKYGDIGSKVVRGQDARSSKSQGHPQVKQPSRSLPVSPHKHDPNRGQFIIQNRIFSQTFSDHLL